MGDPERIIHVPLGDAACEDLERVASYAAWKLSREILKEEDAKGRKVNVSVVSLRRHPRVNPFFYLKKGIACLGGYLVEVEKPFSEAELGPSQAMSDALERYSDTLIVHGLVVAEALRGEILSGFSEEQRLEVEGLMNTSRLVWSAAKHWKNLL